MLIVSPCAHWDASYKLGTLCLSGVAASQSSCAAAFACDGICAAAAAAAVAAVPFLAARSYAFLAARSFAFMIDCSSHLLCDYFDLRKSC